MHADTDVQVWLETVSRTQPSIIVPYVQSTFASTMIYKVRAVRDSVDGHSEISQGGMVQLPANTPVALGRMTLSRKSGDQCYVHFTFQHPEREPSESEFNYRLPCPD